MWERFKAFRYLIGLIVLCVVLAIAYIIYHEFQKKDLEQVKEFEQKHKMELGKELKDRFPEFKNACDESKLITSDYLIKCAEFEELLDKAIQTEKYKKTSPNPKNIDPKDEINKAKSDDTEAIFNSFLKQQPKTHELLRSKVEVFEETSEEIDRIFKLFIKSDSKDFKDPKGESIKK